MLFRYLTLAVFLLLILNACVIRKLHVKHTTNHTLRTGEVFNTSHSGLLVYDPYREKEVIHINENKFFTPASNTKLFTFYSAKKIIKDSIPSIAYCVYQDTLYFTGLGDPTFLHPGFSNQPAFDLLSESNHSLVYIPQFYDESRFGPGWSWDDFPYYYSAEKSPFPIYGNMIWIRKHASDSATRLIPEIFKDQMVIKKDSSLKKGTLLLEREEFFNRFYLTYNDLPDSLEEVIPFNYSNELFTYLLSDTLKKPVILKESFPSCTSEVLYSEPIDSVLKPFLIYSNNFFGEQLLLLSSWILTDTLSSSKAIQHARNQLFNAFSDNIYWVDGSGLSRYNQFTPESMVKLLQMIYHIFPERYIREMFPAGGRSGTLKNSFKGTKPYIYAKTGSMSGIYNLSGFLITKSGRWLIFSFMNNNFSAPISEIKQEMEEVLWRIRQNY